jgi:arylsulfatase A-like enzyme
MQESAPEAVDTKDESADTLGMYGIDQDRTRDFGTKCLLARRLVERGVRFVQVYSGGAHNDDNWDAHSDLKKNHDFHAGNTDKPIAGLLADLKQRGLLDETLVIWGGEFGRQPTAEYAEGTGRDHNSYGFTMWMAGGGIKGGVSVGTTDELGAAAVEKPFHVKNLHATVLNQLGFDPNRLSYFHSGLDQKLVGVEPIEPIHEIIA